MGLLLTSSINDDEYKLKNMNPKSEPDFKNRKSKRQNVLLKSQIEVGSFYFDSVTYDLSLHGAKIKLNLPLERGAEFFIAIKDNRQLPSKVSWVNNGFLGLEFVYPPEIIKRIFGSLGDRLD